MKINTFVQYKRGVIKTAAVIAIFNSYVLSDIVYYDAFLLPPIKYDYSFNIGDYLKIS